jgi:hypothetical protein
MNVSLNRAPALLCVASAALGLAACGTTVSTAGFQGEEHQVAQALSSLQSDATAGDQHKICTSDLAKTLVARLNAAASKSHASATSVAGCERAIKGQLGEVDRFDLSVKSVTVSSAAAPPTATAHVTSLYAGKTQPGTVLLVKEGATWKVAGLG